MERIEMMCADTNYVILVAGHEYQIIGFIGLQFGYAFEVTGKVLRIIALAVSKDYQSKDIAKQLVKQSEEYAMQQGVTVMILNSGLSRMDVHRFYDKQVFFNKGYSFIKKLNDKNQVRN